ncbi:hypothetical protein C8F04DRAFT_1267915 [Mycena alexandri]|uniref:Uncharacterized protein n=1 Tax=Mycena alexandri TaxID=1745969 RepID=A0AAD6SGS5_9AGAR|nr:hypothetical protein C8F04DRAFT_1267915 [Mycena alexandri]
MSFPQLFDAYVPSNGPDLLAASNFAPTYAPFKTFQAVAIDPAAQAATFAYAKRLSSPAVLAHVMRCFYFALALLYTGFPSRTPVERHGGSGKVKVVDHPAHAMTFELYGAFIFNGDIVETTVLHSLQWSSGNSSAPQIITTGMPTTFLDIEEAYPRGDFYDDATAVFVKEFGQKPNCLMSQVGGSVRLRKM